MDKLKVYLAQIKKHHFWILTGLVLIVAAVVWSTATSQLQAKFAENERTIKSKYNLLNGIAGNNPNQRYIEALKGEEGKIRKQVFGATEVAFKQQAQVLPWPDAVKDIAKLRPTEDIPLPLLENYQNLVVRAELERIAEKLRLKREAKGANPNPNAPPMGIGGVEGGLRNFEGIVDWRQEDRDRLLQRYEMNSRPSTIRVRVTQEDFWAFESLVEIVNHLNKDATDTNNAIIKRIELLDIAQWATRRAQSDPGATIQVAHHEAEPGMGGPAGLEAEVVRLPNEAAAPGDNQQKRDPDMALLDGRYLDANNKPVSAENALGYFRREDPNATPKVGVPPFAEFKQMAVVMKFLMDQRKLPDLLAECANSPLPIEVRQVLMHFSDTDVKDAQQGGARAGRGERGPFDAEIEVRGIVYLYNEPDEKKLGTGSAPNPAQRSFGVPTPGAAEEAPQTPVYSEQQF